MNLQKQKQVRKFMIFCNNACNNIYFVVIIDIIIQPQSVNISINEIAEFNCTAIASTFIWKANGITLKNTIQAQISSPTAVNSTQGILMSSLLVTVSSADNATNITCTAFSKLPVLNESEPAILLVQGIIILKKYLHACSFVSIIFIIIRSVGISQ